MATATRKSSTSRTSAQKRVAKEAEQVAKHLHSFAASLNSIDASFIHGHGANPKPTPRNWWKLQAGRFKNDSTFADFVAEVQAARKQEG
jgi:hypothetical protein